MVLEPDSCASYRISGTYQDNAGRSHSLTGRFPFKALTSLLRVSEPETFQREYAMSAQRRLLLGLHYKGFVYWTVAPSAFGGPPTLALFMRRFNEQVLIAFSPKARTDCTHFTLRRRSVDPRRPNVEYP